MSKNLLFGNFSVSIIMTIIIIIITIMMVNAAQYPSKEIGVGIFAQLLAPKKQYGKTTASKIVPFLGLINTCMANKYAPN